MSSQTTQQALPTGTWSVDTVHSTVGFAVPYLAGTFQGHLLRLRRPAERRRPARDRRGRQRPGQGPQPGGPPPEPGLLRRRALSASSASRRGTISRSGDELTIAGELTLKGHTEPVEINGHITDPAPDPYGGERFGLQLETTVDRTKFGLNWNNPLPSGDPALANDVTIIVDLQLAKES